MNKPYLDDANYTEIGFEVISQNTADEQDVLSRETTHTAKQNQSDNKEQFKKNEGQTSPNNASNKVSVASINAVAKLVESTTIINKSKDFTQEKKSKRKTHNDQVVSFVSDLGTEPSTFNVSQSRFERRWRPIPARFLGVKDHAELQALPYKIFLNPSVTEVLCTTTAEALAMKKFVIIPNHPSNSFFFQFPNCLMYKDLHECAGKLRWALMNDPQPLTQDLRYNLSWDAATERLIDAAMILNRNSEEWAKSGLMELDIKMAWLHSEGGKKRQLLKNIFKNDFFVDSNIVSINIIRITVISFLNGGLKPFPTLKVKKIYPFVSNEQSLKLVPNNMA